MKTLIAILLLAAVPLAHGQTNLTPEQDAERTANAQRSAEMNALLNAATQASISNQAAKPKPLVTPERKAPEPENPVAIGLRYAVEKNLAKDTNYAVIVDQKGRVHQVLKRMPESGYLSLARQPERSFLTNYIEEIIPSPQPTNAGGLKTKWMPREVRDDPEKKARWLYENFPHKYPNPDKMGPSGGGDFDDTDVWVPGGNIEWYWVDFKPAQAPVKPMFPDVFPCPGPPTCTNAHDFFPNLPPLFSGAYHQDTNNAPKTEWKHGAGTNTHDHYYTNDATIELIMVNVGHCHVQCEYSFGGAWKWFNDPYPSSATIGLMTAQWQHATAGVKSQSTELVIEQNVYAAGYAIACKFNHFEAVLDNIECVRTDQTFLTPSMPFNVPIIPGGGVGGPGSLEIEMRIPTKENYDTKIFSRPTPNGTFNLIGSAIAGADGVAVVMLPGTNTQQYYTAISICTNAP